MAASVFIAGLRGLDLGHAPCKDIVLAFRCAPLSPYRLQKERALEQALSLSGVS